MWNPTALIDYYSLETQMLTENCPWQSLMDIAYDRWNKHDDSVAAAYKAGVITIEAARKSVWGFSDMLTNSNRSEQIACVLGKLNQQVGNGGFSQWLDNGYASDSKKYLEEFLTECGPVGAEIWNMTKQFLDSYMDSDGKCVLDCDSSEVEWNEFQDDSDRLSNRFYDLEDRWHAEVYALLERTK